MTLPTKNTYTAKDQEAIRRRLFNVLRSVFPDWVDESVANFDNIMVELFADSSDHLLYYQDNQSRQSRLVDATVRKSILALASALGYRVSAATAAQVNLQLTIPTAAVTDIILPSTLRFRTADGKATFRIVDPAIIPEGETSVLVTAENSEQITETYSPITRGIQTITASRAPWIEDSETVTSGASVFTRVPTLVTSGPTDKHYTVTVDNLDRPVFTFGDGVTGFKPVSPIVLYYGIGGGSAGSVEANTVVIASSKTVLDLAFNSYALTVTNPAKSIGGLNRESMASIKKRAPLFARTNARTVSSDDYELNATKVTNVARALLATSDNTPGLQQNFGRLYIVPVDGGIASTTMLNAVVNKLTVEYPKTTTFRLEVVPAIYAPVNISATIFVANGYTKSSVKAQIVERLREFFAVTDSNGVVNEQITFGLKYKSERGQAVPSIALSDIYNVVRDTAGVRKIGTTSSDFTLGGQHADFALSYFDFPTLGDILIRDGDTGAIL